MGLPSESETPRVVISIVRHRESDAFVGALRSVREDERRMASVEVVVLENAAADPGGADGFSQAGPGPTFIRNMRWRGFGANHNEVIAATKSDYCLLVNDDARVRQGAIDKLVGFLDAHPEAAAVGPAIVDSAGARVESAWRQPALGTMALFAATLGRVRSAQSNAKRAQRVEVLSGAALLLRRSALEEVGPFDEQLFMYGEDTDLCRRLGDAGHQLWIFPPAVAEHGGRGSTQGLSEARVVEEWRSRKHYWRKHYRRGTATACATLRGVPYGIGVLALLPSAALRRHEAEDVKRRRRELALHLRNAWCGPTGPGLREFAEEWNLERGQHGRDPEAP